MPSGGEGPGSRIRKATSLASFLPSPAKRRDGASLSRGVGAFIVTEPSRGEKRVVHEHHATAA